MSASVACVADLIGQRPYCSPMTWEDAFAKLWSFRTLQPDWDGQGAEVPSFDLVDSATHLAIALQRRQAFPPSRVLAGVNGTVFLEWQRPLEYCQIEMAEPGRARDGRTTAGHL